MGGSVSRADAGDPVIPAAAATAGRQMQGSGSAGRNSPFTATQPMGTSKYLNLPDPVKYEELTKEVFTALRPETFEGMKFEIAKPLNPQFFLTHSIAMGNFEIPTQNPRQVYKCPVSAYEFGSTVITNKLLMVGRITSEGRMTGRFRCEFNDWISINWQAQLANEPEMSQQICDINFKGQDWNGLLKFGSNGFFGLNYLQSVTPRLAAGGEMFYMDEQQKSGIGLAARHVGDKHIATCQLSDTGLISLSYLHKVGEKASLAADLLYNWNVREATATVGYDYIFQRARVRGRIDSNGLIGAFLEERLNPGVTFILSGEVDHWKKDYKFGFGLQLGE
eukprot:evm.model.scf_130EXC.12 EVM.evm.TU.scf_130EXC.12   scf_130EXC:130493-135417(+)